MSKAAEAPVATVATVQAALPNRLYRLQLQDGALVTAGPSEELKRLGMTFQSGQNVLVRRARLDPARGVIVGVAQ